MLCTTSTAQDYIMHHHDITDNDVDWLKILWNAGCGRGVNAGAFSLLLNFEQFKVKNDSEGRYPFTSSLFEVWSNSYYHNSAWCIQVRSKTSSALVVKYNTFYVTRQSFICNIRITQIYSINYVNLWWIKLFIVNDKNSCGQHTKNVCIKKYKIYSTSFPQLLGQNGWAKRFWLPTL